MPQGGPRQTDGPPHAAWNYLVLIVVVLDLGEVRVVLKSPCAAGLCAPAGRPCSGHPAAPAAGRSYPPDCVEPLGQAHRVAILIISVSVPLSASFNLVDLGLHAGLFIGATACRRSRPALFRTGRQAARRCCGPRPLPCASYPRSAYCSASLHGLVDIVLATGWWKR